jgi:hypothetical protein
LNWKAHESKALGQMRGALFTLGKRLLNAFETTNIVNKMLIATVSYSMAVVKFRTKTLDTMGKELAKTIARHAKLYGDHFETNFAPAQLDGGLGLHNIRTRS